MKIRISLMAGAAALAALGLGACVGGSRTVDIAAAQASGQTCKLVTSGNNPEGVVLCGDASQWAEFDQRAALVNAGVTCQWAPTASRRLCMNEEQWAEFDREIRDLAELRRGGAIGGNGAHFGVPMVPVLMADPGLGR